MTRIYRIVDGRAELVAFRTASFGRRTASERRAGLRLWVAPILVASVMGFAALPLVTRTSGPVVASGMVARATVASTCGLIRWLIDRWRWDRRRVEPFRPRQGWSSS